MSKSVLLEIITPSKLFYKGEIELVICRTLSGDEGFMADHAWACKLLDVGELWIKEVGSKDFKIAAISRGYVDVKDYIIIYTDAAEWSEQIDKKKAMNEKERAEHWLALPHTKEEGNDVLLAKIALQKSITRMNVSEGGARRK
ncbi:MAG: F0F1 ATP synthase subunit epsilon [Peptostreptococcaceae bacterium]|nr:F0F1 ATP synthase subunit epsilon [Peptostreptococcaceae bacterium]